MSEQSGSAPDNPFLDSKIPILPEDATQAQRDEHWLRYVYQGDRMPQLTMRAVLMGGMIGMLTSVSNLYTTLKIGWSFGVAITSCVLSYAIWNIFRALTGGRLSQMSILENNCMQSTASAAGASTGATIATCFGALLILDPEHRHQPWLIVASFTLATASMGVFLAIPMKRQLINNERLPFPSGIAAAQTLKSLYSEGVEATRKAAALIMGLILGAIVGVLNTGEGTLNFLDRFFSWFEANLFNIRLPEAVPEKGFWQPDGKILQGFQFEPSTLLIAAGMIVGLPVSLSMLLSSGVIYTVITPWLAGIDAQHVGQAGYVPSIEMTGDLLKPTRWGLWGGTAIMVFASLTALALQWKTIVRSFKLSRSDDRPSSDADLESRMRAIEVPFIWMVIGILPIAIGMMVIQVVAFSIHWWAGLIAIALSFVLSLVASRATGETDTTPIGAMGKVMQLTFALLMPKQITPNLISAGIAANSASSSADLLTDLKSGYILGANPRKQFLAQFIGVFFGTLAIVPAWYLLIPNEAALQKYPLPATNVWVAVARVLSEGINTLPVSARWGALIGALIGIALPIVHRLAPAKARKFLPSAMGLGLGGVVPFLNALAFVIGALIAAVWTLLARTSADKYRIPLASGLVAGESMLKAVVAMTATAIGMFEEAPPKDPVSPAPQVAPAEGTTPAVENKQPESSATKPATPSTGQ
jgi:uncharacterized oligopeptide transporter (OPT) family protein